MSAQIDLKDLSSFFELFVAYTFAYNSLDSFKKSVNKLSVRDLDDKAAEYTEKVASERQKVRDLLIINNSSSDLKGLLMDKLTRLNEITVHMNNLSKVANVFYSGDFLKPMFYLTGAIYLFYIVICPFQKLLGDTCIILMVNLITISIMVYYLVYFVRKIIPYRKFNFNKIVSLPYFRAI